MDWIKTNPAQFALAILAAALLAVSAVLIMNAQGFQETFAAMRDTAPKRNDIPPVDPAPIENALKQAQQPATWGAHPDSSLLVSQRYILKEGQLQAVRPEDTIHGEVPNKWLTDNGLDLLNTNVLNEDPDQDGFTNVEEFKGKTDPQKKASHPAIIVKLRLKQFIQVPFRLKFNSYDGDPKKPDSLTFQIDTVDRGNETQFLKINDEIPGTTQKTKFKILRFEPKSETDPSTSEKRDVSELTIKNSETGAEIKLVLEQLVNSPDSYAVFHLLVDGSEYRVKKDATFSLKSEPDKTYKLTDINPTEATIDNTKTGEKIKVPKM